MAASRENNDVNGSPNTSEGIESLRGTPATKLTPFSPDNNTGDVKHGAFGINRFRVPPAFILSHPNSRFNSRDNVGASSAPGSSDPFITTSHLTATTRATDSSKLSPTACLFTPAIGTDSVSSNGASSGFGSAAIKANDAPSLGSSPQSAKIHNNGTLAFNAPLSSPYSSKSNTVGKNAIVLVPSGINVSPASFQQGSPMKSALTKAGIVDATFVKFKTFSMDDGTSRALKVSNIAPDTPMGDLDAFFDPSMFTSLSQVVLTELETAGVVYLKFEDIRDADKVALKVKHSRPMWRVEHTKPYQFSLKHVAGSSPVSNFEGQIQVAALFNGSGEKFNVGNVMNHIKELLEAHGDVMAMKTDSVNAWAFAYRAEFFDATVVKTAVRAVNHRNLGFCTLRLSPHEPDLRSTQQRGSINTSGPLIVGREPSLNEALGSMTIKNHQGTYDPVTPINQVFPPYPFTTPSSGAFVSRYNPSVQRTPSSMGSFAYGYRGQFSNSSRLSTPTHVPYPEYGLRALFSPGTIGQERGLTPRRYNNQQQQRGQGKMVSRQHRDQGHHNVVSVHRIQNGADVRTTIMLRNIPNKIDYDMLKEIVDETSRGKYDFMYLRIDFANNCNVGYAFINFEDPLHIVDFVNARAGRRWNCFNSDKVAEISYATIQGKDCLVQKFRNSSVMLEHPAFRPKIFYTGDGPLGGSEEKFPAADNAMKMRRSIENAEHVGLFAPRVGQNFRDEQRRRNSQYDRGTRHAAIEDLYGNNNPNTPNTFRPGSQYGQLVPYYPPVAGLHHY